MTKHSDFVKIHARFVEQYGMEKGESSYFTFIDNKSYDDTKPIPVKKEIKEFMCPVVGVEVKELENCFHVEGS